MDEIDIKGVGQRWREQIEKIIPQCDWFLLLLPSPGDERDWVLFEAGYFFRGQGLTGRMVCLHHPDNEVADALGAHQSVPAELDKVRAFLEGLFHKENWIPGMPPLNPDLNELDSKAKEIVNLIKPPLQYVRFCCGPHMAVAFDDASTVRGWEQLASGRVIDSNEECKQLFGLAITRASFGDWFQDISGGEQGNELRMELAHAVQAIGEGRQVPAIRASFCAASGQLVRPRICAVRRHKISQRVEAIDILFDDVMPPVTTGMRPELAALTITLDLAMRFRYQLLEKYANRKLEREDVLAFHQASTLFYLQAVQEKLISEDPLVIREKVLKLFVGEDKTIIQKMYERSDQLWRLDGKGELDQAITKIDPEALASFVKELFDMNQHFLTVTSKRFVELIVNSELCSKVVAGERR